MSSHHHSKNRRAPCRLLSLILPDKIARRIRPSVPSTPVDSPFGSSAAHNLNTSNVPHIRPANSCDEPRVTRTINILPDDVLLHIFHFDRQTYHKRRDIDAPHWPWRWRRLIHVCRRWRSVVFASPASLDLRLVCGPRTRVELTDIWPPFPIIITDWVNRPMPKDYDFAAAIVHPNRVCQISLLLLKRSQLPRLVLALQEGCPALTHLKLRLDDGIGRPVLALSDGFLGGYAPRLQSLELDSISFPALPTFLLSATQLVRLCLWNIPYSGYFSPEAIVTGLAVLANLKTLTIAFESPLSNLDLEIRGLPPPRRTVLPALTRFVFQGFSEYLEDLVSRIDTPLLDSIEITFYHQIVDLSQLGELMRRTTKLRELNEAHVHYIFNGVWVESFPPAPTRTLDDVSGLRITCRVYNYPLSYLVHLIESFFPSIYAAEHLYIYGPRTLSPMRWQADIEYMELSHQFTSVRYLYICKGFAECIAPAVLYLLQDLELVATDVLPSLESLYLEELHPSGPAQTAIGQFVAARRLLGHPVAVSRWEREM